MYVMEKNWRRRAFIWFRGSKGNPTRQAESLQWEICLRRHIAFFSLDLDKSRWPGLESDETASDVRTRSCFRPLLSAGYSYPA